MHFTCEAVYNEQPTFESWLEVLGEPRKAQMALKISLKIWLRNRLAEAQNWKCCWCGCETDPVHDKRNSATIEHVIPRSQGGTDDPDNLAMSCSRCNNKRATTSVDAFLEHAIIAYSTQPLKFEKEHYV